jgi:hypothetical protein
MSLHAMIGTRTLTMPGNSLSCMPWLIRPFASGFGDAAAGDASSVPTRVTETIVTERRTTGRCRAVAGREPLARR